MAKFKIRIHPKGRMTYFPKAVAEVVGEQVIVLPNAYSAVIFNESEPLENVIASVKIILQDLKLRNKVGSEKVSTE